MMYNCYVTVKKTTNLTLENIKIKYRFIGDDVNEIVTEDLKDIKQTYEKKFTVTVTWDWDYEDNLTGPNPAISVQVLEISGDIVWRTK